MTNAPLPYARRDTLPEHTMTKILKDDSFEQIYYHDTGCSLAPSCLSCPFDECKQDVRQVILDRNTRMTDDFNAGLSVQLIAEKLGVPERIVSNGLKSHRLGLDMQLFKGDKPGISVEELGKRSIYKTREPWPVIGE